MAEIKLFVLISIEDDLNINQYFPTDNDDQKSLTELVKVYNHFKKCGDGCLQTKDYIYYYRTYVPFSKRHTPLFLLFYCTNEYKEKNIENLCEQIFEILDDGHLEQSGLKNTTKQSINNIFLQYRYLEKIKKIPSRKIEKSTSKKTINESSYERTYSNDSDSDNMRGDPRFYAFYRRQFSRNDSEDDLFSDNNAFKNCSFDDSGLTIAKRFNDNITNENFEKWKKLKKNYLIFSIFLSVVTYFLFPLLLRYLFN
jgi:hypothetical protein